MSRIDEIRPTYIEKANEVLGRPLPEGVTGIGIGILAQDVLLLFSEIERLKEEVRKRDELLDRMAT